ncbi:hypothetical protein [Myxococcus landrumensis]|uniref:Lipoprotein n=1 Tax=Myxococcus landrumensis TaxID=2813577 RepID=A0ABX7MYV1_9BACT|nr:hypothetical protein [Myxococcus landrumus]QSQ11640.1 hypothetical protein JY572_24970 [Myxococcus landrumus]
MTRLRVVVAALLLGLAGCGGDSNGDDDGGGGGGGGNNPPPQDLRPNVTGSYASTGTIQAVALGQTQSMDVQDTVHIKAAESSVSSLSISSETLSCDRNLPATMTGETTFSVGQGACEIARVQDGKNCVVKLAVASGQGSRAAAGPLRLSMQGDFSTTCFLFPVSGQFTLDLTGTR